MRIGTTVPTRSALDLTFTEVGGRTVMARRRYRWPLLVGRVFAHPDRPNVGSVTIQNAAGTIIPGDLLRQRLAVVDGGSAVVHGQGATQVTGAPGSRASVEHTYIEVDGRSRLVFYPSPRVLMAHANYRQRVSACVGRGGRAVLVDTVVLHPELTDGTCGSYESTVSIISVVGAVLTVDSQLIERIPAFRQHFKGFGTIYILGIERDSTMIIALMAGLEEMAAPSCDRPVYSGLSELPNGAGWAIRVAAPDGGALRAATDSLIQLVEAHLFGA